MGPHQTCGVGARKSLEVCQGSIFSRQRNPHSMANAKWSVGKRTENFKTSNKICRSQLKNDSRVRRKRIGIDGSHKNRIWSGIDFWHVTEWPPAERGPETRSSQLPTNAGRVQSTEFRFFKNVKCLLLFCSPIDFNGKRLKFSLFTAFNGRDRARRRRGKPSTRIVFILKQALPLAYSITHLHVHGRFHANVVVTNEPHMLRAAETRNLLLW